ncbi:MAG: CocE/NonD family hydrolase [Sphingomonas sp.]
MALALSVAGSARAQDANERPATIVQPTDEWGYSRQSIDIPMRDGVKLHNRHLLVPKGAKDAPILLTRTPYDAESMASYASSGNLDAALDGYDNAADVIVAGGYIRVLQDVRGKHGSEGIYMMNPPLAGTRLNPTATDDSTDAYDTIDWLVKHVAQSNGKVGVLGISYDGFLPLMATINPHPALAVSVPMNPMVDGWRGDDWFHNGAFRQMNVDYIWEQVATAGNTSRFIWNQYDLYDAFLRAGLGGRAGRRHGMEQIGFWKKLTEHPAYDSFWSEQAMDKVLASQPLKVPMMLVASLWDQEDIYGAPAVYAALKPKDTSQRPALPQPRPLVSRAGDRRGEQPGARSNGTRTAPNGGAGTCSRRSSRIGSRARRWTWLRSPCSAPAPTNGSAAPIGPRRRRTPSCSSSPARALLRGGGGQARDRRLCLRSRQPVTFVPRPVRTVGYEDDHWTAWLTSDQRAVSGRPDVLAFTSDVLTRPVTIAGQPVVHLTASTSGTDSDWVVKLIDVYPDQVPIDHAMGGYELAVAMDIFRGRYRETLAEGRPLKAIAPLKYEFALPNANHVFLPGHRIMVQVQSSWFPLYDRNPQKFVPNIFFAKPEDYQKTTQKVTVAGPDESYIALPVVR